MASIRLVAYSNHSTIFNGMAKICCKNSRRTLWSINLFLLQRQGPNLIQSYMSVPVRLSLILFMFIGFSKCTAKKFKQTETNTSVMLSVIKKVKVTHTRNKRWARSRSQLKAVSPQMTKSGGASGRPTVTFPTRERHRPLTGTKLYCLVTEAHVWTTCLRSLPDSVLVRSRTCTSELPQDYKSVTLPLDYRATQLINVSKIGNLRVSNHVVSSRFFGTENHRKHV